MRKRVPYREDRGCARKRHSESPASISTLHRWRRKRARPFFIPGQKTTEPKLNTVHKDDTKIYTGHKTHRMNKRNEQQRKTTPLLRTVLGCILPTPDAPGQRAFSRCAASFFLEIRQDSCGKMSCSARKFLAAGHIGSWKNTP